MLKKETTRTTSKGPADDPSPFASQVSSSSTNKTADKTALPHRFVSISMLVAITVWIVWLRLLGPNYAIANMVTHWEAAVTMIFGSIVAGGTSMGGGAVAFPVFTKVLHVPPSEAKVFSLAIQSVGMSAAALTIVAMKTRVEWKFIHWASFGGIPGIILGSVFLAPALPPNVIKLSFTMMIVSFGIVLLTLNRAQRQRNLSIPFWEERERFFALAAGFWGGIVSGLVGSGMDIVCFSTLVLLFGMCEKVSTPTSVILMAINAVVGFIIHQYFVGDFNGPITNYWLAAVPVVVVGAPMGAILCNYLSRTAIVRILLSLVLVEFTSSFALIPLSANLLCQSLFSFAIFSSINYWMYKSNIYTIPSFSRSRT